MSQLLYIDTETFSEIPIAYGSYKYAEQAEILIVAYAFAEEPVQVWDVTTDSVIPLDLKTALNDPAVTVVIHNSSFDRTVLRAVLKIDIPVERIHDTLVQARTVGLPGALSTLCDIFKIPAEHAKDKRGKDLIRLFCVPRPKNSTIRRATHETHPEEWRQFIDYARLDIEATRKLYHLIPKWNYNNSERALWHLDQRINDTGLYIDTKLAEAAIRAIDIAKRSLNAQTSEVTYGFLHSTTQRDELLRFILGTHGITLPDTQKDTLERRLNDPELPQAVRELIANRLQICTTSTAKYQTVLNCVNNDGRLRGTLEFCGAGRTGRYAGRKFQPQNLPSKNLPPQEDIDLGIETLKNDCADLVFDNIMKLTSSCIRGCITAPPGKKLIVADLANIEGRDTAWLAGEEWKIQAFRDYDAGAGPDLYKLAYAKAFNIGLEDVTKPMRNIGKVMELMLGYGGGVSAFLTGAATYGIDLDAMAHGAQKNIPKEIWSEATRAYDWAVKEKRTLNLESLTYKVCDSFKRMWREANPNITAFWGGLERAVIAAIEQPGKLIIVRDLKLQRDGSWLRIVLPSGRALCYVFPRVEENKISYMGISPYSKKWGRIHSWGGKLMENLSQAIARDIMMYTMPKIENAGYTIVLTVHDEIVTEVPDSDEFTAEGLSALLSAPHAWCKELPLAASGFESYRYRKQ